MLCAGCTSLSSSLVICQRFVLVNAGTCYYSLLCYLFIHLVAAATSLGGVLRDSMALHARSSEICPPEAPAPFHRVLHQMWLPPHDDARDVPAELIPLGERWSTVLTHGWKRRLWTSHAAIRQLWVDHFPNLLDVFDGYPNVVQRADASRLVLMSSFGGVCEKSRFSKPMTFRAGVCLPLIPLLRSSNTQTRTSM